MDTIAIALTQKNSRGLKSITQSIEIYNNQKSQSNIEIDTLTMDYIFVDINQIHDTTLKAYGFDGSTYTELLMVNAKSKNSFMGATTKGIYQIDAKGYSVVRFTNVQSSTNAPITASIISKVEVPVGTNILPTNTKKIIKASTLIRKVQNVIAHDTSNGKIYGSINGYWIRQSVDGGLNWTTLYNAFNATYVIKFLRVLENGNCLVLMTNGKLYLSTDNFVTFNEIMDFGVKAPHVIFGMNVYKNNVLVTEYGLMGANAGKKVYLSTNYGQSFSEIFNLDAQGLTSNYHTHSAAYDPYERLIWVCVGDGIMSQMYFVASVDAPTVWYKVESIGNSPTQATYIMPLRDCVLFASDSRLVSVVRYNRPSCGTKLGSKLDFECAKIFKEAWGKDATTEVPIASTAYIDYGNSIAYFGYALIGNSDTGSEENILKYGEVWGTNGHDFTKVYSEEAIVGDGIFGVWCDLPNNKMVIRLVDVRENTVICDMNNMLI